MSLLGKIAIVTGGGSGIGEAVSQELARRGSTVVVADINSGDASRVAEAIGRSGGRAEARQVDVSGEDAVRQMVEETGEQPGMSAFARDGDDVFHTYSAYSRGFDGLWTMWQWLDRAPLGRNEGDRSWFHRHDEYLAVAAEPLPASRDVTRDPCLPVLEPSSLRTSSGSPAWQPEWPDGLTPPM